MTPMSDTESFSVQHAIHVTEEAMEAIRLCLDDDDGVNFVMLAEGVRDVWTHITDIAKEVMEL